MRILFIRHGDPDYINDTHDEKMDISEANCCQKRAADLNLGSCYVSPLGRAKDTAQYCLDKVGKTAQTVEWLREFPARIDLNQAVHLQKAYPTRKRKWSVCAENRVGYRSVVLDGTWRMYGQGCVEKIRSMPKFRCGGSI